MLRDSQVLLKEANHVMTVCNACRYCEGFCAVFPAMELRRTFTEGDMKYFANLCHNCRGCYYACQYAPPHEFDLNIPKTFAELRLATYKEFASPAFLRRLLDRNERTVAVVSVLSVFFVLLVTLLFQGARVLLDIHTGEGAFYAVVPYAAILAPFSFLALLALYSLARGVCSFWKAIGAPLSDVWDLRAHRQALQDVFVLRYLGGGGHGCNYPDEAFSMNRRYYHHFVFYGFLLCFASTTIAFFYDHGLGLRAPYSWISLPVILGTLGGLSVCFGAYMLHQLKKKMDQAPASSVTTGMDTAFTKLVFWTSASGLVLLLMRSTGLMGLLLTIHLGLVLAFFLLLPYGKFLHGVYRYFALVRNAQEQRRADEADAHK